MPRRAAIWAILSLTAMGLVATEGVAPANSGQDFSQIERGRYLAIAGDCAACHTKPGGRPYAGGLPIETPFGSVVAPNLTPDNETGIGLWTDEEFVRAVTRGIRRDGAYLFPAMPYPYYTRVKQDDVLAIRAYLATLPPVSNSVAADQLPFPLSLRADMAAWNKLYFTPGAFQRNGAKSAEWNRGAYLGEGLMHCGACHTPKNLAGGDKTGETLQGSVLQGWFAPDLTNDLRRGLGGWSVDDIAGYLKTGHNRFAAATGPMADEITQSSSQMSDSDLHAVATWLKDQPAPKEVGAQPVASTAPMMKLGAAIYRDECSACHTPNGAGIPGLFPALAGAPSVQSIDPTSIIRVVLAGTRSVGTEGAPTAPAMPGFAGLLSDRETAAVLAYIRNAWGNAATAVTSNDVATQRRSLAMAGK
jgi:mono/diheme cytochrome c family protein